MMRLLDTNILSEIVRPGPNPQVMARLFAQTHGTDEPRGGIKGCCSQGLAFPT